MSNIFTTVKPAILAIDTAITRAIRLFWISTLQEQRRHGRELQH